MGPTVLVLANNDIGLYKFRKELLQELIRLDYKVYISLPDGEFVNPLVHLGCEFINTPIDRRGTNLLNDLKLLFRYKKIIRKIKPDVVLTYTIKPNIYGGMASRFYKVKYLTNITGLGTAVENKGLLQKLIMLLYRFSLKKASCVFFQNSANQNLLLEKHIVENNYRLIPGSGVNLYEYSYVEYPDRQDEIRLLFIGRIMKSKGINELLSAAKEIKKVYPNIHFDLVGECEEDYASVLSVLEKEGIIKYHGKIKNIKPFIDKCHAIILPSYHEGIANVLLESASTGRPILASKVAGCQETFDEGISGYGFEVKNVDSLLKAIISFIKTPYEMKKEMGIAGRIKMENEYNRQLIIDAYIDEITK